MPDPKTTTAPAFNKELWSKDLGVEEFKERFGDNHSVISCEQSQLSGKNHFKFISANCQHNWAFDTTSADQGKVNILFADVKDKMIFAAYLASESASVTGSDAQGSSSS